LTASDDQNEFVRALQLGCCGIVQKQAATNRLIESIRRVHSGDLAVDPYITMAAVQRMVSPDKTLGSPGPSPPRDLRPWVLSQRQIDIVILVAQGFKNSEIAIELSISEQTVKNHLHHIFEKLELTDRLELALYVVESGLHIRASAGNSS
jgi:DNA-binding NarL/FixJ family response regulator